MRVRGLHWGERLQLLPRLVGRDLRRAHLYGALYRCGDLYVTGDLWLPDGFFGRELRRTSVRTGLWFDRGLHSARCLHLQSRLDWAGL